LEDIAKVAADEKENRIVQRHADRFKALQKAVKLIDNEYEATKIGLQFHKRQSAKDLYERQLLDVAAERSDAADDAEKLAKNLIGDLRNHLRK
jgi:hypothetical protein